jgi:uncharacterized SAM-binding protein YcdF (DUF218 family)
MRHRLFTKKCLLFFLLFSLGAGSVIPVQRAIAYRQAPQPQAILVLEGRTQRIRFAAEFAQKHTNLPIWVSGNPDGQRTNQFIFQEAGIDAQRVHYDFCAIDTVTNFTCTVRDFRTRQIRHIYVITSDYHMTRSLAIAYIVLGSRGIIATPLAVPSADYPVESPLRTVRDCVRSLVWLVTGLTGARLQYFI